MKYLDLKTLSKKNSISVFTLRKFVKNGLPHYRLGRKILVDPDEFDTWFKDNCRIDQTLKEKDLSKLVHEALSKFSL